MPGLELVELSGRALAWRPWACDLHPPNTAQKGTLVETHAPCTVDRKEACVPQAQAQIRLAAACCWQVPMWGGTEAQEGLYLVPCPSIKISALHRETGHSPDNDGRGRIETKWSSPSGKLGLWGMNFFLNLFQRRVGRNATFLHGLPRAPTAMSCPRETRERLSLINFLQLSFQWCWKVYANPPVIRF